MLLAMSASFAYKVLTSRGTDEREMDCLITETLDARSILAGDLGTFMDELLSDRRVVAAAAFADLRYITEAEDDGNGEDDLPDDKPTQSIVYGIALGYASKPGYRFPSRQISYVTKIARSQDDSAQNGTGICTSTPSKESTPSLDESYMDALSELLAHRVAVHNLLVRSNYQAPMPTFLINEEATGMIEISQPLVDSRLIPAGQRRPHLAA